MKQRLTRGQAIHAYCKECMCGQVAEIRKCPCPDCPLYPYRTGKEEKTEAEQSE